MADLLAPHRHTTNNRAEVEASKICGYIYCTASFSPIEIVAWSGLDFSSFDDPDSANAGAALCPRCGSEAVIGDKSGYTINQDFLNRMNEAWSQRTIVRRPAPKK